MEQQLMESAKRVVGLLHSHGLRITTVESCTGGGVAYWITNVVGASDVFSGASVAYSSEQKVALGVPPRFITEKSIYSEETAIAMAWAGITSGGGADVSIGITGRIKEHQPSRVFVAVVYGAQVCCRQFCYAPGQLRHTVKEHIILDTLNLVAEHVDGERVL